MLKNPFTILFLTCLATACTTQHAATRSSSQTSTSQTSKSGSIEFINTITLKPDAHQDRTGASITAPAAYRESAGTDNTGNARSGGTIENYDALRFKYAILENASVEEMNNPKLLSFMDYWYGAHYRYGGTTRDGIDCSAFAFLLLSSVYGIATLPRTAKEQYSISKHIKRDDLQEGDLVFFHTLGRHRTVTHVGVYLRNNRFIHASLNGVMISDMNDGYYDKHFIGAGRILDATASAHTATPVNSSY